MPGFTAFFLGLATGALAAALVGRVMVAGLASELRDAVRSEEYQRRLADDLDRRLQAAQRPAFAPPTEAEIVQYAGKT